MQRVPCRRTRSIAVPAQADIAGPQCRLFYADRADQNPASRVQGCKTVLRPVWATLTLVLSQDRLWRLRCFVVGDIRARRCIVVILLVEFEGTPPAVLIASRQE
jgi:hypothetical protein